MKTIGWGRYRTETYPQSPGAAGGAGSLVRVGYDISTEEFEIPAPSGENIYLPKDAALTPLQVAFPSFTPGNTLEVDFKLNGVAGADEPTTAQIKTQIVVSLDGGTTFYTLTPSGSLTAATTDSGVDNIVFLRSLDSIQIVDPMTVVISGTPTPVAVTAPPIVRVVYQFADDTMVVLVNGGTDELTLPGVILKCSEIPAAAVFQGPFGQLATT